MHSHTRDRERMIFAYVSFATAFPRRIALLAAHIDFSVDSDSLIPKACAGKSSYLTFLPLARERVRVRWRKQGDLWTPSLNL
jgi:hypothetical protein